MTLEIITSSILAPLTHGFFTRKGGASSGIFSGLNCGFGSSDQANCVDINRGRVAQAMEVKPEDLLTVNQTHSSDVIEVTGPILDVPKADALVTRVPGVAIAVLTADCQPVLLADTKNGVIGAAHAGWKGAISGILEATVSTMQKLGAQREHIKAAIGPSISQRAYEVGPDFFETFMDENPEFQRFFAGGENGRMQFDLPSFGLHLLRNTGIEQAEWTGHCTYSDPLRFYSYRRSVHESEADYGRLISTIRL